MYDTETFAHVYEVAVRPPCPRNLARAASFEENVQGQTCLGTNVSGYNA